MAHFSTSCPLYQRWEPSPTFIWLILPWLYFLCAVSDCICVAVRYLYSYYRAPINVGFAFDTGIGCALAGIIGYVCYLNTVFIITLMMFERYMAVCHTFYHRKIASKRRALKLILACWILAFMMALCASGNNSILTFGEAASAHAVHDGLHSVCTFLVPQHFLHDKHCIDIDPKVTIIIIRRQAHDLREKSDCSYVDHQCCYFLSLSRTYPEFWIRIQPFHSQLGFIQEE